MGYYKTTGIVLRRMNLGEADRIITFFTREHGKVKAVARGVRRIKSRMAGHLEPFGSVELMLASGRNLDVITSARLVRSGDGIADSAGSLGYGFMLAEMIDRLVDEGVEHEDYYDVAEAAFSELAAGGGDALTELYLKLRMLETLGYRPQLEHCSVCGGTGSEREYFFNSEIGGIVEASCVNVRGLPISTDQIKLWRLILTHSIAEIRRIGGADSLASQSLEIVNSFFDYTFGRHFGVGTFN